MDINSNSSDFIFDKEQYSTMCLALARAQYATKMLSRHLFNFDDPEIHEWINEVAFNTGIDASHLRDIFLSGMPMTLQDYLILSDYAEIDPINDPEANRFL